LEEENAALEREKRDALECQQRRHEEAVVQLFLFSGARG
jgi:hypothetical protein